MEGEGGGEAVAPGDSDTCSEHGGANCESCIRCRWRGVQLEVKTFNNTCACGEAAFAG